MEKEQIRVMTVSKLGHKTHLVGIAEPIVIVRSGLVVESTVSRMYVFDREENSLQT